MSNHIIRYQRGITWLKRMYEGLNFLKSYSIFIDKKKKKQNKLNQVKTSFI